MSDRRVLDNTLDCHDEDLSALLDGELPAGREAELRALMTARPELAQRYAELDELNSDLRGLAGAVSSQQQLDRLREAVDRRVVARQSSPSERGEDVQLEVSERESAREQRADVIVFPAVRRYGLPAAALLAAGLALYLSTGRPLSPASPSPTPELELADVRIADSRPATRESPPAELASLSEEELAIAFEYEMLTDFEVIERLELLELLSELDSVESM